MTLLAIHHALLLLKIQHKFKQIIQICELSYNLEGKSIPYVREMPAYNIIGILTCIC